MYFAHSTQIQVETCGAVSYNTQNVGQTRGTNLSQPTIGQPCIFPALLCFLPQPQHARHNRLQKQNQALRALMRATHTPAATAIAASTSPRIMRRCVVRCDMTTISAYGSFHCYAHAGSGAGALFGCREEMTFTFPVPMIS